MFEIFPVKEKATLISAVNNSTDIFEFGIPLAFGVLAAEHSIPVAFGLLGCSSFVIGLLLIYFTQTLRQKAAIVLSS